MCRYACPSCGKRLSSVLEVGSLALHVECSRCSTGFRVLAPLRGRSKRHGVTATPTASDAATLHHVQEVEANEVEANQPGPAGAGGDVSKASVEP